MLIATLVLTATLERDSLKAGVPGASPSDQPVGIKFSHATHVGQLETECTVCHTMAPNSKFSSDNILGGKAECATCHDVADAAQCNLCHVGDQFEKLPAAPRELLFSHEAHVTGQNLACSTCHAGIENAGTGSTGHLPPMATCNTCHNDHQVTNTCESCHTNFVSLVPADHQQSDFRRNHRDITRLGALDAQCQTCHQETFCQECHQPTALKSFKGNRDLSTDPRPRRSILDSPRETVLQNVHSLNYRFTHGVDAKARQSDCASCHEQESFCVQCHQAGGNITQFKFKPATHAVPGFATLGVGSGGGLHAEEARRDIENCMSCHNVEGQDPSCMTCHLGSGKVR